MGRGKRLISQRWLITLALCAFWLGMAPVRAASDALITPSDDVVTELEEQELDEVIVSGMTLREMREAIVAAEQRFYDLYNELNQDDDFDIHCREHAPLGTRIKQRQCLIAFQEEAQMMYARAMLNGEYSADPVMMALELRDEFRRNALAIINGDARLLRLVKERERLEEKYKAERRKRFKGRWILFE
jgi:hypothetical protein